MKSSAIYHRVVVEGRQSDRSYGADTRSVDEIRVGSSASNSHTLGTVTVDKVIYEDRIQFTLFLDGNATKRMIFKNNNGVAGELIDEHQPRLEQL